MTFQEYVMEHSSVTAAENKRLTEKVITERGMTYYKALCQSSCISHDDAARTTREYYHLEKIENAFEARIDFEMTRRIYEASGSIVDIPAILRNRQFYVRSEDRLYFVLNDPENDADKNKARILAGTKEALCFALITDEEYEIFRQYQIQPERIALMSRTELQPDRMMQKNDSMTQFVKSLFENALAWRATDLRITPMGESGDARIWLTVDGKNIPYTTMAANILPNLRNVIKNMCSCPQENQSLPVEGRLTVPYEGRNIDVRVNIVPSFNGYDFNFRFITSVLRNLEDLGMNDENLAKYKRVLNLTKGLVVISGPTGSGKTSLMYAGFRVTLSRSRAIFSIEDPVEINLPGIVQCEVNDKVELTRDVLFASALRHRPDIVAFGEIRNFSDAQPAINFAHTGHPAHATLHANDSVGVISRFLNMGVDPYVLGDTLAAVISQRLVRRVCPCCGESYQLEEGHPWRKTFHLGDGKVELRKGSGCAKCAGTGYYGQMAINEIMITSPEIRAAIQEHKGTDTIRGILKRDGFKTYLDDGREKALQGLTTFSELEDIANDIL